MIEELIDRIDSAMGQFHANARHYTVAWEKRGSFARTDRSFPILSVTLYMSEEYGNKVIEIQQQIDDAIRKHLNEDPKAMTRYVSAIIAEISNKHEEVIVGGGPDS